MIDELQEMQGMEEPGIFLKEGNRFGIGELAAVKIKDRGTSARGEGRIKMALREQAKERKNSRRGEVFDCALE